MLTLLGAFPGALLVAASSINLNFGVLGAVGGGIVAIFGAYAAMRKLGPQRKLMDAQADEIEGRIRQSMLKELQGQREEVARAQAAEAEAIAEIAQLVAAHSRDRAEWKDERHDFINTLAAREKEVSILRQDLDEANRKITALEEEVHTLRIAAEMEVGRRAEDLATARRAEDLEVTRRAEDTAAPKEMS